MSTERDLSRNVRSWLHEDQHEDADRVLNLVLDQLDTTPQRPAGRLARRFPLMNNTIVRFSVVAAAVLVAAFVGLRFLPAGNVGGDPSPTPKPPDWTGPLRPDAATMPLVAMEGNATDGFVKADRRDAAVAGIDIATVGVGGTPRLRWGIELAGIPQPASTLDPTRRIIEYGLVLDLGGDRVADCLIGINNHAPVPGDFRVWMTNLATGETAEQIGPPYGYPVDFSHPDEQSGAPRSMSFFLLPGAAASLPCDIAARPMRFYAFASVTDAGRIVASDYAPDAAWLAWPYENDQP